MSKLTLSINQPVIDQAKEYARSQGKSLSRIVEEYLANITKAKKIVKEQQIANLVDELRGSVKMPKDTASYDEILEDALLAKYLNQ